MKGKYKRKGGSFIIVNELSEVFCGLKGGYPQFTKDWEMAKPMFNNDQFMIIQRGCEQKLEILQL